MEFNPNISPVDVIKKEHLKKYIIEIFILILQVNLLKTHGKNLKN